MRRFKNIVSYLSMIGHELTARESSAYKTISAAQGQRRAEGRWNVAGLIDRLFFDPEHCASAYAAYRQVRDCAEPKG